MAVRNSARLVWAACGAGIAFTPLAAQQSRAPSAYDRAIAAGYKAAITCSAVFIGGRSEADLAGVEFKGIYADYNAIVPTLTAKIDRKTGTVEVPFDARLPPRRAVYRAGTGCTNLPIGSNAVTSHTVPPGPVPADPRPWPLGDALPRIAYPALPPVATALDGATYGKGSVTTGVVVLRGNSLIAEQYAPGFGPYIAQRTWSVAKSITGTLVGIAVGQGAVKVDAPARVPEWQSAADPRRNIKLDNLLHMASGLHSATAGNRTDDIYFGGSAVTDVTVSWPLDAKPGTRFRYANNDILLAMRSLRAALGEDKYKTLPATALFGPLGMKHTVAETDWRGNYISSSQVWTTARDLGRFGLLYLNGGVWNGRRILPAGWTKYVATPGGPQPESGFGYGASFWLLDKSPGVPAETYAAIGNRGQYVVIVPSRNIVIVRRGEDPTGASFDIARFTADILAAVK